MKEPNITLDKCVALSDELFEAIKTSIIKLGRHSPEGYLVYEETWPAVYEYIQLREEYKKLKKDK